MMISAKVGDSIELDCSSDSYPHPEALWYKYNIPLLDITYRKLEETLKFRKLVLNNLLLADAGNYSCQVNGTLGSIIYRTFILYVYGEYGAVMNFFSHTIPLSFLVVGALAQWLVHWTAAQEVHFQTPVRVIVLCSSMEDTLTLLNYSRSLHAGV